MVLVKIGESYYHEKESDAFSGTVVRVFNKTGMAQTNDPDPFVCTINMNVKAAGKITARASFLAVSLFVNLLLK